MTGRRRKPRSPRAVATALALLVFCSEPLPQCQERDAAAFDVAGSCGPPGVVTLSYAGATQGACSGNGCFAFLEAPGANAAGLPEQGEVDGKMDVDPLPGYGLRFGRFALVGPAPLADTSPPVIVERHCRATASDAYRPPTVVTVTCEGATPAAACTATLTLRGGP